MVVFVPADFKILFPQFSSIADAILNGFFTVWETTQLDNTETAPLPENLRKVLFDYGVAHLCELSIRGGGTVGNITSASEGSTSVGMTSLSNPFNQWLLQTQYGATYYQMILPLITGGTLFKG